MIVYAPRQLEALATAIFGAAGAPSDIAAHVAHSLVEANLVGHDSHGVLRIPSYLELLEKGAVVPAARPSVTRETATTAAVDGNWAFGMVTARFATNIAIEKARTQQVAAVSIVRLNHIGRLGEYTELAARNGMFAFMTGAAFNSKTVAPFGGASGVMSTNPISFAVPSTGEGAVIADIATSVVAEGKVRVARAKKQPLPPGAIIDSEGNPTTDPERFYAGGALLPVAGHKGYAMAVIADLVAGRLASGEKMLAPAICFGGFLMVVNVEAFRPLEAFRQAVSERATEIKAVRPAAGFSEVLMPGEPEQRTREKRSIDGIALPEDTVQRLSEIASRHGIQMPEPKT